MQTVLQSCRQSLRGNTLSNLLRSEECLQEFKYYGKGRVPWQDNQKCGRQPEKKRRKIQTCLCAKYECGCEVLRKPKRNTYEWVVEDEIPCKPFGGMNKMLDKTVYEMRKFQKCFKKCGDIPECYEMAPDCSQISKVYPMTEAVQKGSLPGCARPIPETKS